MAFDNCDKLNLGIHLIISAPISLNGRLFPLNGAVRYGGKGLRSGMIQTYIRQLIFGLICMILAGASAAQSQDLSYYDPADIIICPASMADTGPPDFSSAKCKSAAAGNVDPQGTLIWVRMTVPLVATRGSDGAPLSLYLSGKMSSEVYLNGTYVGRNGRPADDAEDEVAGVMDAELFPPQDLFRLGDNEIIFRASSHRGFLNLDHPFHMLGIAPTGMHESTALRYLGPAFITLGVFLVGALYFGIMAFQDGSRLSFVTLGIICLLAGGQLLSEALRGLFTYAYPVHDLRLIAIAAFSFAFGITAVFHIFRTFAAQRVYLIMAGVIALTAIGMFVLGGYDHKALIGMALPLLMCLIATGIWTYEGRPRAFLYFVALLVFLGPILILRGLFLDTAFFVLVAAFLMFLFVGQARAYAEEGRERRKEEVRADRLEQALAEVEERAETSHIDLKSAGKIERVLTSQIIHCRGASGYSEIVLAGGRTLLHSATLAEMEDILPSTFLRVHRSHLINLTYVKSLNRDPSGTGTLTLSEGDSIPVSRRIMPKVRKAML